MSIPKNFNVHLMALQTRRNLLKNSAQYSGLLSLAAWGLSTTTAAETPLNRFPRMVQKYYVNLLKNVEQRVEKTGRAQNRS